MSTLSIESLNKRGTFYGKERSFENYKQGDTVYYMNLHGKIAYGKIIGFRRELADNDNFLSFIVIEGIFGETDEVFTTDVVFSF
jgi:hypothetical protein